MRYSLIIAICILLFFCSCSVVRNARDLQQVSKHSTTHKIAVKKDIDLNGATISFPKGCVISFKKGSIANGHILFDSNPLKGNVKFINCSYDGTIKSKNLDDRCFSSSDDEGTLRFLLANAIENGAKCVFSRDYRINMKAAPGSGFLTFRGLKSGANISFEGHTIYNTMAFPGIQQKPFLCLIDVKNITIRDCFFHDTDEHNARKWKNSSGCTFIHCYGDCESINLLNCSQENGDCILRSGVYTHSSKYSHYTPYIGLTNSTLKVKGLNVGYGLAIYCGDNLDIDIDVTSPHRGFYCTGVSNSTIKYKGFDPKETKCHILIKDAVYKRLDKNGDEVLDMKGCHDLVIKAEIDELQRGETVITFQSYGSGRRENADFTFRTEKCHHYNIDFSADIKHYPESGYFLICNCASDSGALSENDIYGCKLSDITIHDVTFTGSAKKYMCLVASSIDADISIRDCDVVADSNGRVSGFTVQVNGSATGKVRVINGVIDNVLVNEKTKEFFDVELENTRILNGVNYQNMQTSKRSLIRLSR